MISDSKQVSVIALLSGSLISLIGIGIVWYLNPHDVFYNEGSVEYLNILLVFLIWNALISFFIFVLLLIMVKIFFLFRSSE